MASVAAVGVALCLGVAPPSRRAGRTPPRPPAPSRPPTAADAPFTKTVNYLVSQMTPAEQIAVIRTGTDPNPHGQAGYLTGVPRLGIPGIRHADALGLNVYADATGFPNRLGIASSFDRSAYTELGAETAASRERRSVST